MAFYLQNTILCNSFWRLILSFLLLLQMKEKFKVFYLNIFFNLQFAVLFILCMHMWMKMNENNEMSFTLITFPPFQICSFLFQPSSKKQTKNHGYSYPFPHQLLIILIKNTAWTRFNKNLFLYQTDLECDLKASVSIFKKKTYDGFFSEQSSKFICMECLILYKIISNLQQ